MQSASSMSKDLVPKCIRELSFESVLVWTCGITEHFFLIIICQVYLLLSIQLIAKSKGKKAHHNRQVS